MLKIYIISIIFVVAATIVGLSLYLQIDDLGKCGEKPGTIANCQTVDAVVAVSGGDTIARSNGAIDLYKNGWADRIIFSGAAQDKAGPSNASVMKNVAISAGIPATSIYLDEYSETTKQNAQNAQTIFTEQNIKSIILVTSAYHQRRADLEFQKRTKGVMIFNHSIHTDKDWSFWWWLTPYGWWLAIMEIIKIIIFYSTGSWV
jgi:uncharacterized SAM-binding protein YcdF (DUF218 family)